ncbi:fatty acid--CoA ligase family protein [Microbacterium binotii]|uniref:class I adenylate-forming enzyme family protein n=1 Tax=Microbacterium binotii TaxID=462710 RepID=UPI0031DCE2AE
MSTLVVPVEARDALARLDQLRRSGRVLLVLDDRWPPEVRAGILSLLARTRPPAGTQWAALTSGSSAAPRVVVRTHASWADSFPVVDRLLGTLPGDVVLLPAPPSSSLTLFSLAHAQAGGPAPELSARSSRATLFHGTPTHFAAVLASGGAPMLRAALVGGMTLPADVRTEAESRGIRVVEYYGAAELSFVAFDDDGHGLRPFPGVEIAVHDGVIWARSAYTAIGYLDGPGPLRRDGAWASVGDRGRMEGDRLYVAGREDDAIQTAGATVIPSEIERVLRTLDGVADAVVVGMPAPGVGRLVAALIEPVRPGAVDAPTLRAAARRLFAPAHRPRLWFAGTIARTSSGKIARAEVERRLASGEVPRV